MIALRSVDFCIVLEFNVDIAKVFGKGHKDLNKSLACFDVTDKRQNKMEIFLFKFCGLLTIS